MPATTPNRLYPYPVAGDPVDIPGDIQRLAEAIDDDLTTVGADIVPRPFAQISSSTIQAAAARGAAGSINLTFDTVDYDNFGMTNIVGDQAQIILPDTDFWWVYAEVEIPQVNSTPAVADPSIVIDLFNTTRTFRINICDITDDNQQGGIPAHVMHVSGVIQQASAANRIIELLADHRSDVATINYGPRRLGAFKPSLFF